MRNYSSRRALMALASMGLLAATLSVPAAGVAEAASADATVTVVHGIPDTPVDVYVNGTDVLPDFLFTTVSPPLSLPPGTYAVAVRLHGASPSSAPILSATETLSAGENATIVANLTAGGSPTLTTFANPTAATLPGDTTLIVRHTAYAPAVDVYAGSTKVISALTNPNQATLSVPAGTVPVSVTAAGGTTPVIGPVNLSLAAGDVEIVYAIGSLSGGSLTAVVQTYSVGQESGYFVTEANGNVYAFGDATSHGTAAAYHLNGPIVGMAPTPDGGGYWLVGANGGVYAFGDAKFYGSAAGLSLNAPIVGIAATADGGGYWLVASDGGVFSYGDAPFEGSEGGQHLNAPIVGLAAAPGGAGYWLVASDGGVFSFGDAPFEGSAAGSPLNAPVVGVAAVPHQDGYWLVGADGGVFSFGTAAFYGSEGGAHLNAPVRAIVATPDARGYWLVGADGGIFTFGSATYNGSVPGLGVSVGDVVGAGAF